VKTFKSACRSKEPTETTRNSGEDTDVDEDSDSTKNKSDDRNRKPGKIPKGKEMMTDISPQDISVDTSQTQETSTISDSMANPEQAFARMCIQNPDFLERFLRSNPEIKAVIPGASNTPSQQVDPQEASSNEGNEASL
jgi:hypothetical protein